jgi:hypothetical protein
MNKMHRNGVLIDTNLLLLLIIGSFDPALIKKNKITANRGFDEADFNRLLGIIGRFQRLVTTPHILTEVSNHSDKVKGEDHKKFVQQFISLIDKLDERWESSKALSKNDAFVRFGLADTAISRLAEENFFVVTVDLPFAGYLQKKGVNVVNFNNIRQLPQTSWMF